MRKIFFAVTLILSLVLFLSCNKGKIAEYEKTIETLNSQIALLQEEIDNYKQKDQYYYQSGVDEYCNGNYTNAIDWMNKLKIKFPTSSLIPYANKIIEYSETEYWYITSPVVKPHDHKKNFDIYVLGAGIEAANLTDQYFYQYGADEFLNENYWEALVWMGRLKVRFPSSPLLRYADKIIEDSKLNIDKVRSKYVVFEKEAASAPPVKNYYIPGVGNIPQKLRITPSALEIIQRGRNRNQDEPIPRIPTPEEILGRPIEGSND